MDKIQGMAEAWESVKIDNGIADTRASRNVFELGYLRGYETMLNEAKQILDNLLRESKA